MNKRVGILSVFVIATLLLMGLIGALVAQATDGEDHVDGTIALDQAWYTTGETSGSEVTVTVTDADVNVTVATSTTIDILNTTATEPETLETGDGVEIVGVPLVLVNLKTDCDITADVDTNINVAVFNAGVGTVVVSKFNAPDDAQTRTVCYDVGQADTLEVFIWSTQTGEVNKKTLVATETEVDSGEFEATIKLVDFATDTLAFLHALNLNTVSTQYVDDTPLAGTELKVNANSTVETAKPVFSNLVPVNEFATQSTQPTFTGTVSDSGSGLDIDAIIVKIGGVDNVPTITGVDGDLQVTFTVTPSALTEGDVAWQVRATDLAGNNGLSDADPDEDLEQETTVRIDSSPPDFATVAAITGNFFDAVDDVVDDGDDMSIEVLFDEKLDAASVSATDFTVDGLTPLQADVFSDLKTSVFLTLGVALDADATPLVAIATGGAVSDLAGNAKNTGSEEARDGIAPTFDVTLDKDLTNDEVLISISADEKISGVPTVEIWKVGGTAPEKTLNVIVKTLTSWEAEFTTITGSDGDKAVFVTGQDLAVPANVGTKGNTDPDDDQAIVIEQDTTPPTVGANFNPADDGEVFTTRPFVKFTYGEDVTVTKAEFGLDGEDATDVTSLVFSSDDEQWIYSASDLIVGEEYTITVEATDDAGNESPEESATFIVEEREAIEYPLVPGNNLISLAGTPANTDINSVGLPSGVQSVISYQPGAPGGPWLVATRGADGNLSGTLTIMDALHAYWVDTNSPAPMEVDTPLQGFAAVLPSINVVAGWNLVPVVVLNVDNIPATISADQYFGSVAWVTAYSFDTATGNWTKVLPRQVPADTVAPTKGYWLFAAQDGVLVP